MEDYIVNLILVSIVSWASLFLLVRKIFPNRSFDFCNRIVSTIHASSAVTLASLSVEDWRDPVPLAPKSSTSQMKALAVSVGYLIYDLVCCLFDNHVNLDNSIHHLVSIVGLGSGLAHQVASVTHALNYMIMAECMNVLFLNSVQHSAELASSNHYLMENLRKCGSEMVAALWITEISSPFLHMRELLKELGYRDTDLNLAADICFALIFTFARMIGGPYLTCVTLSADYPLLIKAMALGLQLVSTFWFYKIARMVKYKLIKRSASKKVA